MWNSKDLCKFSTSVCIDNSASTTFAQPTDRVCLLMNFGTPRLQFERLVWKF